MSKRFWSILIAGALISSVFTAGSAQAAHPVPEVANIEDPANDANTTSGDNVGPANVSNVGDIRKVWFTNDAAKISVHFQTTLPPGASATGFSYRVNASPDAEGVNCLIFRAVIPGRTYIAEKPVTKVFDACGDGSNFFDNGQEGEIVIEELEDGTGLTTMTFDRSTYPALLGDGQVVAAPVARTDAIAGEEANVGFQALRADDTKVGTDYTISSGGAPAEPPSEEEPPAGEEPKEPKEKKECKKQGKAKGKNKGKGKGKAKGKNKGCKNGKGPKEPKGPGEPAPAAECAPYTPGERGGEAETTVVTSAATAEAPIELELEPGPAAGFFYSVNGVDNPLISHAYQNVQVDTDGEAKGLYVRIEFPNGEDQDLFLRTVDDEIVAQAAGGNQAPAVLGDGTGTGGHSEGTAEQLDGVLTADCGGYTVEAANAFGMGHTVMKLWLGDATWDPTTQEPVGAEKAFVF